MNKIDKNIIFIDGECMLCDSFAQFVSNRDKFKIFYFSALQDNFFKEISGKSKNKTKDPSFLSTIVLYYEGKVYYKSKAIIKILSKLPFPWTFVSILMSMFPNLIRDFAYNIVAKIRYKLFGKKLSCELPKESFKNRVI